jgi:hypothetical protein
MRTWLAPLIFALVLLPGTQASARASDEYTYRYEQLWQATIRLLRVDLGCQITDRDDAIGFVMFDYPGAAGRTHGGSVELVRSTDSHGTEHVRVTVTIPTMPTYIEQHVLTRLGRKLREDFGLPPRVHVTRPPPTEGDGDMHDDEEEPPPSDAPPSDGVSSIE